MNQHSFWGVFLYLKTKENNMQGWFKIHRQIEDWEWYKSPNTRHLFEHLIGRANVVAKRYKGMPVHRGELITSIGHLSDQTGLSINQVRLCLRNLESTEEIVCTRTNRWTKIKVVNYTKYQGVSGNSSVDIDRANHTPNTLFEQTKDSQNTLIKECKEGEKKKNLIQQEKTAELLFYEQEFEDFWNSYQPVSINGEFVAKGSKKLSKDKFIKILNKGEKYENIKRGVSQYLNYCQTNAIKSCGCAVFLNQQRWLDDYSGTRVVPSNTRAKQQIADSKVGAISEVINYYHQSSEI